MRTLRWNDFALTAEIWHFARLKCRSRTTISLHIHEFCEVFWIEDGIGEHELNGRTESVSSGSMVFIRAGDRHGFRCGPGGEPFTIANFALRTTTAAAFQQRWSAYGLAQTPWAPGLSPLRINLTTEQLSTLEVIARELADTPISPLAGDRFLSALVHEIHRQAASIHIGAGGPDWLVRAITGIRSDDRALGLETFYRLAGRSREHVARACRHHTGLTPTELVTRIRLDRSRRLLERTDLSILDVALESGFANMSLFHRRFRAATGLTPLRYRQKSRLSLPVGKNDRWVTAGSV